MVALPVIKCHAAGNDFVLLDNLQSVPYDYPSLARFLCRRRFGIGADGLLVALPASDAQTDVGLRIFNADGSEADMCGNGIRCLAKYVMSGTTYSSATLRVATKSGTVRCETIEAHGSPSIRVAMGVPCFAADGSGQAGGATRRLRRVRVGNAHCVVFTGSEVATFDLRGLARDVNAGARLGEEANVEIFRVVRGTIELRIWERGVGETMACG
ncbi:MAG: diaminopimelate epimerase, partial [Candidatus Eremiobacteraeota bacterium]|nr:diaminopimelate epimerase [Candidatus Eremiobacteraeota bacterium]